MLNKLKYMSVALLGALALFGCEAADSDAPATASGSSQEQEVQTIKVGTSGTTQPFSYRDETGELTGYDVDVIKAVFEELPKYEVEFEMTEFDAILSSLDSNRYQIAANNFSMTEERKEKYIFSEPYYKNSYEIVLPKDVTSVKSMKDLAGKTTESIPGSNQTTGLEKFNAEFPENAVEIKYAEGDPTKFIQNVASGRTDFYVSSAGITKNIIEEHNFDVNVVTLDEAENELFLVKPYSYFLFSKNNQNNQLIEDFNTELNELKADGTLAELSEKHFGKDLSPAESE